MLVSYTELRTEAQNKWVGPVSDAQVNGTSIDLRLGRRILVESRDPELPEDEMTLVSLRDREPLTFEAVDLVDNEPFLLYPGQFILANTVEEFNLPLDITAEFRLNSSAARMGLGHELAVWCDPGWTGSVMTLELFNSTQHHIIALYHGDRIGQVVFHRHKPVPKPRSYALLGAYNHDAEVSPAKGAKGAKGVRK